MGRTPCCEKDRVTKGAWSAEEDALLKSYIQANNGTATNWISLPRRIGLNRCGKSCRLRWLNYLRPNINHGGFSEEEDNIIANLYFAIGSRWSIIAEKLRGRTDNDIKNYWNTKLQKKFIGKQKKSSRRLSSYGGFLGAHESYNRIDYIHLAESPNPDSTAFTITNNHLMPSNWTHPTLGVHHPPTKTIGWPSSKMICFALTNTHCEKQQQEDQHGPMNLHRNQINSDVGSSTSSHQHNNYDEGNVNLGTILSGIEATLFANDLPYQEIDASDLMPCNRNEKEMVGNYTTCVASNDSNCGESVGSLDWNGLNSVRPSSLDEFDNYINWEDISLMEVSIDAYNTNK